MTQVTVGSVPMIDPSSYHVFEYQNEKLLFDVGTGALSAVNGFTYRVLELAGSYSREDVLRVLKEEYPGNDFKVLDEVIDHLKSRGLFASEQIGSDQQRQQMEDLWRHKPRRLQLFLAQLCNLKCRYCYAENNKSNAKRRLMSFEVAKAAVDYLIKKSGNRPDLQITFFGGEPTLNFKVMRQVVDYCKRIGSGRGKEFLFELISNGTLLEGEIAEFALDNDFLLFVSIDGWREMHNHQRPSVDGKDYYDRILRNARHLVVESRRRKSRHRVKIRANLTPEFHDVRAVARYLESFDFRLIGIGAIGPLPYAEHTPMAVSQDQLEELEKTHEELMLQALEDLSAGKRLSAYVNRTFNKTVYGPEKGHSLYGIICGIGRNTNAVDCEGNIYPCHRYVGMDAYILGNIWEGLNRQKTMGLYEAYNRNAVERCSACWVRHMCAGGCPWELSPPDGTICERPEPDCEARRKGFERALWLRKEMRRRFPKKFEAANPKDRFNYWKWED